MLTADFAVSDARNGHGDLAALFARPMTHLPSGAHGGMPVERLCALPADDANVTSILPGGASSAPTWAGRPG